MGKSNKKQKVKATVTKKKIDSETVNLPIEENEQLDLSEKKIRKSNFFNKIGDYFIEQKDNLVSWYSSLTTKEKIIRIFLILLVLTIGIIVISLWATNKF